MEGSIDPEVMYERFIVIQHMLLRVASIHVYVHQRRLHE